MSEETKLKKPATTKEGRIEAGPAEAAAGNAGEESRPEKAVRKPGPPTAGAAGAKAGEPAAAAAGPVAAAAAPTAADLLADENATKKIIKV